MSSFVVTAFSKPGSSSKRLLAVENEEDAEEGEKVTPGGVPDSSWSDKDKERAGSRESSESFE
jgi:hypothetical protein